RVTCPERSRRIRVLSNPEVEAQRSLFNYLELLVYLTGLDYGRLEPLFSEHFLLTTSEYKILTHRRDSRIDRYKERIGQEIKEYHVYLNKYEGVKKPEFEPKPERLFLLLATRRDYSAPLYDIAVNIWDNDLIPNKTIRPVVSYIRRLIRANNPELGDDFDPVLFVEPGSYQLNPKLRFCIIARDEALYFR
ncbi:hypothetical protein ACFL27_28430, partial [candidate division CSSED10-310 bacterium]